MGIRKYAVEPKTTIHLLNANDEPMFADGADGKPDESKPMKITIYGPGSKVYSNAQARQSNRAIDRLKAKGKTNQTAEEKIRESSEFLTAITDSFENIDGDDYGGKAGKELYMAVYSDLEIGFVAEQVAKAAGDWSGFSKPSTPD